MLHLFLHATEHTYRSSNKMPAAVKEAISAAVETHGQKTPDDAREFVATMEREGRLVEESWS